MYFRIVGFVEQCEAWRHCGQISLTAPAKTASQGKQIVQISLPAPANRSSLAPPPKPPAKVNKYYRFPISPPT